MSHSIQIGNTAFIYNSDLSGDVKIVQLKGGGENDEMNVPGDALMQFAAKMVRENRISALERASDAEILGLKEPSS
jgi:hypothetical protein